MTSNKKIDEYENQNNEFKQIKTYTLKHKILDSLTSFGMKTSVKITSAAAPFIAGAYIGASDAVQPILNYTTITESPNLESLIGIYITKIIFDSATAKRRERLKTAVESTFITPSLLALGYATSYMAQYIIP